MKDFGRVFAIVCVLALGLALSSCGEAADTSSPSSTASVIGDLPSTMAPDAIKLDAMNGTIPEIDFKLGDKVSDFKRKYPFFQNFDEPESTPPISDSEVIATITDNWHEQDITMISVSAPSYEGLEGHADAEENMVVSNYFLRKERASSGFSFIGTYGPAFDFLPNGTFISDVKAKLGNPAAEGGVESKDAPFLMGIPDDCVRLTYTMGENTLCFYFTDDLLYATSLEKPALWKQ